MIKLWIYILVWLIHITSMHISFGNLYAYKLSPLQAVLFNEGETCWKSKSMCMVATLTGKSIDIYIMFCAFSFIFSSINLISLWAHRFSCGLLKLLVQGPTWPLEYFTKLHPCWVRILYVCVCVGERGYYNNSDFYNDVNNLLTFSPWFCTSPSKDSAIFPVAGRYYRCQ